LLLFKEKKRKEKVRRVVGASNLTRDQTAVVYWHTNLAELRDATPAGRSSAETGKGGSQYSPTLN
jgi:hypothetical protein